MNNPAQEYYKVPEFSSKLKGSAVAAELIVLHIIVSAIERHALDNEAAVRTLQYAARMYGAKYP